jgi:hypothetical protein
MRKVRYASKILIEESEETSWKEHRKVLKLILND